VEQDILKAVVGIVDVIGLYIVFNAKRMITVLGDINVKIMAIGLGWAAADILSSNFIDIIFQAWSNEMKPEFIKQAIFCNFELLEIMTLAAFAYTLTKKETSNA
jgi:hypothetical protein